VPQGRRYFKAFDVFALTSDHEPFGMVLLEAMAAGVPVICSDCGGGREVVEGVGRLFAFGDASALSSVLLTMDRYGEGPRQELQNICNHKLRENFSDASVRSLFWRFFEGV
jgi:glycosyltransferase involved in cell wall biosynthesis